MYNMNFLKYSFLNGILFLNMLGCLLVPATSSAASEKSPIIFVHGMLASGDTYTKQIARFRANGYDPQWLHAFDWNTLSLSRSSTNMDLDLLVDSVLRITHASKVYLVGHSAGSGLVYNYSRDPYRSSKIAGVALIGGFKHDDPAGPHGNIPTLNIFSDGDMVARGNEEILGATNLRLTSEDHYEVATGWVTFEALYKFMNNNELPATSETIEPANAPIIFSGKAVSLGNNEPAVGGKVSIYKLDKKTANRISKTPKAEFTVDYHGRWGPFKAERNAVYEFVVKGPQATDRSIHYFREVSNLSNPNIYLRSMPSTGFLAMMFSSIPEDPYPALAVFSSSKAVITGRDSLFVDGTDLTKTEFFRMSRTTIAVFLYDGNGNRTTDLSGIAKFNMQGTFLAGIDMALAKGNTPMPLEFNGRKLLIRRVPSSEGVVVPVFD